MRSFVMATTSVLILACVGATPQPDEVLRLKLRRSEKITKVELPARKTALILCDMWDKHWCDASTARVNELAPRMNEVVAIARSKGVLIIHAPSDTMDTYRDDPLRKAAKDAPNIPIPMKRELPSPEPPLPIDDSDGGCDPGMTKSYKAWTGQHPALKMLPGDAITDSGDEVYRLMEARGIDNLIVMGVHTNMCILNRSFAIRRMIGLGKNVVLMRDMTDTMYNPKMRPFVGHFEGTRLVIEHIEKYLCPTVTSTDLTGKPEFKFKGQ